MGKGEFDAIRKWQENFDSDHVGEKGAKLPTAGQLHSFDNSVSFKAATELLKAYNVKLNKEVTRRRTGSNASANRGRTRSHAMSFGTTRPTFTSEETRIAERLERLEQAEASC